MPSLCPGPYVAWPPTPRLYPQTPIDTELESLGRASPVQAVSMTTDPHVGGQSRHLWRKGSKAACGHSGEAGARAASQRVSFPQWCQGKG